MQTLVKSADIDSTDGRNIIRAVLQCSKCLTAQ